MSDEDLKNLVLKHDHTLESLALSMEHFANEVNKNNTKLDKVVEAINTQNVLIEKFNNMEQNLKESFSRVHDRSDKIQNHCDSNTKLINSLPSATTARWIGGFLIIYLIAFGVYVVSSIHHNENQITYLKGRIKG